MRQGTHENRFQVEIDGIGLIEASEMTPPNDEHTPFELHIGNEPRPRLGRGNSKVDDFTFKHASALNDVVSAFMQWLKDFQNGDDLLRRGARLIVFDEDGKTPVNEYILKRCVPRSFKLESHSAGGTNASMFTCAIRAEDMEAI